MANKDKSTVDLANRVEDKLSGAHGFANSKKLRKLGNKEYRMSLEGKLAGKLVRQNMDPRRTKRQARKEK
ncbi:MAG: hypothetical protein MI743_11160 [Sneathiellales bacterium]|nr:hypothetical protein [Sneathiellales bacterium]